MYAVIVCILIIIKLITNKLRDNHIEMLSQAQEKNVSNFPKKVVYKNKNNNTRCHSFNTDFNHFLIIYYISLFFLYFFTN